MSRKQKADNKNLFQRGNVWWVVATNNGQRLQESTGATDIETARAYRDRLLHPLKLQSQKDQVVAVRGVLGDIDTELQQIKDTEATTPLALVWPAYQKAPHRPDSGEATMTKYAGQWYAFLNWCKATHPEAKELRDITPGIAAAYSEHLLSKMRPQGANKHLNFLAMLFKVLSKSCRLAGNPFDRESITRKRAMPHSRRELTVEELGRVCEAAQGEMRLLFAVGIYTGLRLADCALLNWSSVDMVKGIIALIPRKTKRTGQRVTVPIHPQLGQLLAAIPPKARKGFVMPEMAERYPFQLVRDIQALFQSCDIQTGIPTPGRRQETDVGFHSLRHSFVSLCANSGVPMSVVQSIVGHSNPAMTEHYLHVSTEALQKAVRGLPSVTGGNDTPAALPAAAGAAKTDLLTKLEAVLEGMTAATWQTARREALNLIGEHASQRE
jgi:integrase